MRWLVASEKFRVLPLALRRPLIITMALAALVFITLASRYAGNSEPGRLDAHMARFLTEGPWVHYPPLRALVWLGEPLLVIAAALFLAGLALVLRRPLLAVLAILGPGLTGVTTTTLKPLIGRVLRDDFAYPSGHTAGVTALGIVAALLLISLISTSRTAAITLLALGAGLPAIAMTLGLSIRDWHYPTDAIGGFCTAIVVVFGAAFLIDYLTAQLQPRYEHLRRRRRERS